MESLYESSPEMCPAEPDGLANVGCSDGCELLTGEVCEASWWDGLLSGSCAEGSGGDLSEGQQVDTSMVSSVYCLARRACRIVALGAAFPS